MQQDIDLDRGADNIKRLAAKPANKLEQWQTCSTFLDHVKLLPLLEALIMQLLLLTFYIVFKLLS